MRSDEARSTFEAGPEIVKTRKPCCASKKGKSPLHWLAVSLELTPTGPPYGVKITGYRFDGWKSAGTTSFASSIPHCEGISNERTVPRWKRERSGGRNTTERALLPRTRR